MKLPRRQFLHRAAGAVALPAVSRFAWAQAYPVRPVRFVVAFAAGGGHDVVARLIGQSLSERLGQQFVIENRPGGGGNVGTQTVVNAPADGYTLLLVGASHAIGATLYDKLNFNVIRDIAPVAGIMSSPLVLEVHPGVPVTTVAEFIAYAKVNPGRINFASAGNGTLGHLPGELFKMMAGVDLVHVPYRSEGPALTDLLGGQVQAMFGNISTSSEHVRAGKLRPLGVTAVTRSKALPDIPTVSDVLAGYEVTGWFGVGMPKHAPAEIVDKLNKEINAALADANIKVWLAEMDATPLVGSPADFGKLIVEDAQKWAKVVSASGAKAD